MLCTVGKALPPNFGLLIFFFPASILNWFGFAETNLELCPKAQRITTVFVLTGE